MAANTIVLYPNEANIRFDMEYYLKTHMPLCQERWAPFGLKEWYVKHSISSIKIRNLSFHHFRQEGIPFPESPNFKRDPTLHRGGAFDVGQRAEHYQCPEIGSF